MNETRANEIVSKMTKTQGREVYKAALAQCIAFGYLEDTKQSRAKFRHHVTTLAEQGPGPWWARCVAAILTQVRLAGSETFSPMTDETWDLGGFLGRQNPITVDRGGEAAVWRILAQVA